MMEGPSKQDGHRSEVAQLKEDLAVYRELIIKFNNVLEWEQSVYPVLLTFTVSTIYFIAWLLCPSFITIFSLSGILYFSLEFFGPRFLPMLQKFSEWNSKKESQFCGICIRLLNGKTHFISARGSLLQMEKTNPKLYYPLMAILLSTFMWLGLNMNSFFISYILSIVILLMPGFRRLATNSGELKVDQTKEE